MTIGRGKPKKAINQSTAPNEKNQNSSSAQSRCVTVARAKTVKNVWERIRQIGNKKMFDWREEIRKRIAGSKLEPTREAEIIEELGGHLEDRYAEVLAGGVDEETA